MYFKSKWFLTLFFLIIVASISIFTLEALYPESTFLKDMFEKSGVIMIVFSAYYQYKFSSALNSFSDDGQATSGEMRAEIKISKDKINKYQLLATIMLITGTVIAALGSKIILLFNNLI